jgi:hypothetical protein
VTRAKTQQPDDHDFVVLGDYSPHEASKLLARFEQSTIAFRADPKKIPHFGAMDPSRVITISIDPARSADADIIHRELFGDGLPNYGSSFFHGDRDV